MWNTDGLYPLSTFSTFRSLSGNSLITILVNVISAKKSFYYHVITIISIWFLLLLVLPSRHYSFTFSQSCLLRLSVGCPSGTSSTNSCGGGRTNPSSLQRGDAEQGHWYACTHAETYSYMYMRHVYMRHVYMRPYLINSMVCLVFLPISCFDIFDSMAKRTWKYSLRILNT